MREQVVRDTSSKCMQNKFTQRNARSQKASTCEQVKRYRGLKLPPHFTSCSGRHMNLRSMTTSGSSKSLMAQGKSLNSYPPSTAIISSSNTDRTFAINQERSKHNHQQILQGTSKLKFKDWLSDTETDESSEDTDTSEMSSLSSSDSSSSQTSEKLHTQTKVRTDLSFSSSSSSLEFDKPYTHTSSSGRSGNQNAGECCKQIYWKNKTEVTAPEGKLDHGKVANTTYITQKATSTLNKQPNCKSRKPTTSMEYIPHEVDPQQIRNQQITDLIVSERGSLWTCPNNLKSCSPTGPLERSNFKTTDIYRAENWKMLKRLAVVTEDCITQRCAMPVPQAFQVRKGEVVYIIGHHTWKNMAKNNEQGNQSSWLYVRRWCTEHSIATGLPGFIPSRCSRRLTPNDILGLCNYNDVLPLSSSKWNMVQPTGINLCSLQMQRNSCDGYKHNRSDSDFQTLRNNEVNQSDVLWRHKNAMDYGDSGPSSRTAPKQLPMIHGPESIRSLGSEIDDFDSGRGPSSGSDWGSGRGESSNIALDKTFTDSVSGRNNESNMGRMQLEYVDQLFCGMDVSEKNHNSQRCVPMQHSFQVRSEPTKRKRSTEMGENLLNKLVDVPRQYDKCTVTLTTLNDSATVLEMKVASKPLLRAPTMDKLNRLCDQDKSAMANCSTGSVNHGGYDSGSALQQRSGTLHTGDWEPYKTVLHLHENKLEKFTLV